VTPAPPRSQGRRRLRFLAGFLLYFAVIWGLWDTLLLYPLQLFVVFLHEVSHGLAAVATGGTIRSMGLTPGQGGYCHCPGGNAFLTLSAGYLGSLAWGGLILEAGQRSRSRAPAVTGALGWMVAGVSLLFVRTLFGIVFGVLFGLALVAAGRKLSVEKNRVLLTTLGLTSCLYAVLDIKSDVLDRPHLLSDAAMLAELTGIPTRFWGVLWIAVALAVSGWLFLRAYRRA